VDDQKARPPEQGTCDADADLLPVGLNARGGCGPGRVQPMKFAESLLFFWSGLHPGTKKNGWRVLPIDRNAIDG